MSKVPKRLLKVFLCHTSGDKPAIRALYRRLKSDGVDVWLDEKNLLPGQDWQLEIPNAVKTSDAIIVCISNKSITKEGYVQKEINFALDIADEKPEGTIFIIPCRLESCAIPVRLSKWQYVDLFFQEGILSAVGYEKLLKALSVRATQLNTESPKKYLIPTQSKSDDLLKGKWKGDYQPDNPSFVTKIQYEFLNNGRIKFFDMSVGYEGSYWVDFSVSPAHLNIFAIDAYGGNWKWDREAILEFIENDIIRLEYSRYGRKSPSAFGENAIVLKRVKT